MMYNHS